MAANSNKSEIQPRTVRPGVFVFPGEDTEEDLALEFLLRDFLAQPLTGRLPEDETERSLVQALRSGVKELLEERDPGVRDVVGLLAGYANRGTQLRRNVG